MNIQCKHCGSINRVVKVNNDFDRPYISCDVCRSVLVVNTTRLKLNAFFWNTLLYLIVVDLFVGIACLAFQGILHQWIEPDATVLYVLSAVTAINIVAIKITN